jgi:EAL domain-containing protein (putative c-di-GMP-specific phosphodiesterase class I)/PAS domain-containing protein/GGDEF domain-containing protein
MTAQQPPYAPVRLLIAENSENAAHRFDSLLRDAGIATRPEIIDLPMAMEALGNADMMLCNASLPNLHRVIPQLREKAPHVPIIIINNETTALTPTEVLELGAADAVADSEARHLVLVVRRELEHVCQNLRLHQTRRALDEAEQRCQLLLQGSKAAIAYVHEGMHIYANEVYLKLFGFNDADDLLGLPLIDLLDASSADTLKTTLKKFRSNEEETEIDFAGTNTDGDAVSGSMTLASAEYEGEHCLQVTVRTNGETEQARILPVGAVAAAGDGTIPTLTDSTAETSESGNGLEFKLELEDHQALGTKPQSPAAAEPDSDSGSDTTLEPAHAADNTEPEPQAKTSEAGSGSNGTSTGQTATSLGEFLAAGESYLSDHSEAGFSGVFVAQVDGYQELQQNYGLTGAERVCNQIQSILARTAADNSAPNMALSAYQWAVMVSAEGKQQALDLINGVRQTIEELMLEVKEKTVRPSVTFGGAQLDREGCDSLTTAIEDTLDSAFSTAQAAAESGEGNCVELPSLDNANSKMDDEANRVLVLINEAIESQKFMLLFQPIISLRGDSDEHYEVFLRMMDRNGEQMAPNEFLRTAVENGVAGKIDRWVILQSIKMLSNHRSKGHNTRLTINVTSNSVADGEFIQWLGVAIKAARLPSDAVIFQITESDASNYIRQTREFVEGLKNIHCRSSLSRFGLAAEPFEILRHIPVDFVKLDGSHIESLAENPDLKDQITDMIQQLQGGGKLTIVPMVESANVLSALWQAGANYIQGHYLQQPSTSMDYDFSTDD